MNAKKLYYNWKYARKEILANKDHWVKSVCIRSLSGTHLFAFGLNTEIYRVNLCIQLKCRKMRTRYTPNTVTFHVANVLIKFKI